MKVCPQTVPTPKGYLVGYKAVTRARYPLVNSYSLNSNSWRRVPPYKIGSQHIATATVRDKYEAEIGHHDARFSFSSIHELRRKRTRAGYGCMPGIHLCNTPEDAYRWAKDYGWSRRYKSIVIIPVAYTHDSVVGNKKDVDMNVIITYKITVLG